MEYELLGWPADGVTLALDYRAFGYAGKFVMSNTGKAVALDPDADDLDEAQLDNGPPPATDADGVVERDGVVGAVTFNADRTDDDVAWLRYVTVREDRRGEGIGPRLVRFTTERLRERGFDEVRIAVNNPFAYEALYRAGFAFTGEETGIAEVVLEYPGGERAREDYQAGLDVFRDRAPAGDERAFLDRKREADLPAVVDPPG